jgi:signal transduction histidine kinase
VISPFQVLLVEDNALDTQIVKALILNSHGEFECMATGSLASALDCIAATRFDAILLDLNLPDCQGLDTFLELEKHATGVAIVPLTATDDDRFAIEAVRRGAQDYLVKGAVTGPLLLRSLRYAIERKQIQEALGRARDELEIRVAERTAELRALSHRLVEAQETERRTIARELHDEVGQALTGLKLVLGTAVRQSDEKRLESLVQAQSVLSDLMGRVRDLSLDLRPSVLDDLGLLHALLWHIERYSKQTGVQVDFTHGGLDGRRFRSEIETSAFRIVQEALTNVARYAAVDRVDLEAQVEDGVMTLKIKDQGGGFDVVAALAAHRSIGLAGMRERAGLLNGSLTIDSSPGKGTSITARLPLDLVEPG